MQFKASALALALAAVPALAQNLGDLPQCAEGPTIAAIGSTGCQPTDLSCICKDQSFLQSLEPQIQAACSPADLQKALQFAQSTCASAGVTLSLPAATGSATAAPSSATSAAAAPTTVTAAANGTSGLGPGPVVTASSNISSAASFVSSAVSAATSLAASIASSNATVASATRTGSSSGAGSSAGATAASGASGSSGSASASASAGAAAANLVQSGVGLVAGVLGALLAL